MNTQQSPSTRPTRTVGEQYRFVAVVSYCGVLVAWFVDWSVGPPPWMIVPVGPALHVVIFFGLILSLVLIEFRTLKGHGLPTTSRQAALQLALRLLLVTSCVPFAGISYIGLLYLVNLLYAYLALGRRVSYGVAVFCLAILFGRMSLAAHGHGRFLGTEDWNTFLFYGLAIMLVLLLAEVISRESAGRAQNELLLTQLKHSHQQLQEYAAQVATLAAAEERNRLARDIHDSLGHHLAAISVQLEKAIAYRQRDPQQADAAIEHARRSVREALHDVRQSVGALRQSGEVFSLESSLQDLASRMGHNNLTINLHIDGDDTGFSKLALMTLYRAAQEGLTNIHKHARATQADLHLEFGPQQAHLRLTDNGQGFDPQQVLTQTAKGSTQFGLQGVRERITLIGGQVRITSQPAHGTTLEVTVPKQNDLKIDAGADRANE